MTKLVAAIAAFSIAAPAHALLTVEPEAVSRGSLYAAALERLYAFAVNSHGHIAGTRITADYEHCMIWTPLGGTRDISPDAKSCWVQGYNDDEEVVGVIDQEYFSWTKETGIVLEDKRLPQMVVMQSFPMPSVGDYNAYGMWTDNAGNVFGAIELQPFSSFQSGVWWDGVEFENLTPDTVFSAYETCNQGETRAFCTARVAETSIYDCRRQASEYDYRLKVWSWRTDGMPLVAQLEEVRAGLDSLVDEGLLLPARRDNLVHYNIRPNLDRLESGKAGKMPYAVTGLSKLLDKLKRFLGDNADHPTASGIAWNVREMIQTLNSAYGLASCDWEPLP